VAHLDLDLAGAERAGIKAVGMECSLGGGGSEGVDFRHGEEWGLGAGWVQPTAGNIGSQCGGLKLKVPGQRRKDEGEIGLNVRTKTGLRAQTRLTPEPKAQIEGPHKERCRRAEIPRRLGRREACQRSLKL